MLQVRPGTDDEVSSDTPKVLEIRLADGFFTDPLNRGAASTTLLMPARPTADGNGRAGPGITTQDTSRMTGRMTGRIEAPGVGCCRSCGGRRAESGGSVPVR